MTLGPIFFAAPWALAVLAALPALFLILRATPPAPRRAVFPPLRLLIGLTTEEESRQRAPIWLVLLRAFAAALLIIGFARPSLAPQAQTAVAASGPILVVIDDGWTSAPVWSDIRGAAEAVASDAERSGAPIHVLLTAPRRAAARADEEMSGAGARAMIARLEPQAWRPDRADALKRLADAPKRFARIVWMTDGLASPDADTFGRALAARGPLTMRYPVTTARAVTDAAATAEGLAAEVRRGPEGLPTGALAAESLEGRALAAAPFRFEPGAETVRVRIDLPPEIAARAARVRIVSEQSAGAVRLLPAGSGRPLVGLVDVGAAQNGQTLLQDLFYVERAVSPFATARRGEPKALINQGAQALILPDASRIAPTDRAAIDEWLEKGGLLVRFAGPRLANDQDDLLPVRLRPGARALGGALAWEQPQRIAPLPADSPFAGLTAPEDVAVRRQVLAEPSAERDARVWARLTDGAAIVTAAPKGRGLVVLFHVTAGPDWSDLPLSGLYVDMLRRTLAFAGRAQGAAEQRASADPWRATRLLDGFGVANPPGADAQAVPADAFAGAVAGPATPPGLYERTGGDSAAIDAARRDEPFASLPTPQGATRMGLDGARPLDLGGPAIALAALLVALDLMLALYLAGRLPRLPRRAAAGAAAMLLALVMAAPDVHAQSRAGDDPTLTMRLAYIRTGDPRVDRMSAAGLEGLTQTLIERTAVEPGRPVGVDPARDDLSVYPVLYWPAPETPQRLSDAAVANLDRYMRLGGLLFIDTRDAGAARPQGTPGPAAIMLQGFDAPPLEPVTAEHVLGKAFYLMSSYPGRLRGAKVWAESASAASARDGVAALMVGDGDWASAWAVDASGRPLTTDGRQRELALRFGVNLVMVALTGNYKADQVHLPALLERLGQPTSLERRR